MMNLYDQVSALFAGFASAWSRMLLFFATCFIGHAVGHACVSFGYKEGLPLGNLPLLSAAWFFGIFQAFTHAAGVIYLPVLLVAVMVFGLTDISVMHPVAWLFPVQMWNSFVIQRFLIYRWDYQLMERKQFSHSGYLIAVMITSVVVVPYIAGVIITWIHKRTEPECQSYGSQARRT